MPAWGPVLPVRKCLLWEEGEGNTLAHLCQLQAWQRAESCWSCALERTHVPGSSASCSPSFQPHQAPQRCFSSFPEVFSSWLAAGICKQPGFTSKVIPGCLGRFEIRMEFGARLSLP